MYSYVSLQHNNIGDSIYSWLQVGASYTQHFKSYLVNIG